MEGILIPLFAFAFIALIVKMSLDYNKWKQTHKNGGGRALAGGEDKSLGVSELRNLIEEAVHSANEPLMERIARLEHQLENDDILLDAKNELKQLSASVPDRES